MRINLNDNWKFAEKFDARMISSEFVEDNMQDVRLPHTCRELPFHYFDESEYQMLCGYRRHIEGQKEWASKHIELCFEAAGHDATVYLNGEEIGQHHTGYTAFSIDISDKLRIGEDNILVIQLDSRETLNTPPFGFVIDYMTYGGLYREVYLEVTEKTYIADVFSRAYTKEIGKIKKDGDGCRYADATLKTTVNCKNADGLMILQELYSEDELLSSVRKPIAGDELQIIHELREIELWDVDDPKRYRIVTSITDNQQIIDYREGYIGIRKAEFTPDGFYLNDRKLKIRGLNRHQSYAYVGYAMPESMQRFDADVLKNELGCNAVRTSHYPQSQYFIDECDKIGLLVFTEFPGWQHIGDDAWKEQACDNVKEMILQYRNHPSIILWGVRINESKDDDEFYKRTNEIAHSLDDSRPTGGVRCHKKSHLFEDVYTYNDFVHDGKAPGCEDKSKVTSDMNKAYLVSEYNGHMYPTKAYDWEEHRVEHAIRHANVLDAVASKEDIAGSFGWCMFDYNTHKDFGSGDRICYHGVMDMFRNPKLAALMYSMQQEDTPVLELSSSMDIGEHPGCNRGKTYIFSNADSIKMYKNNRFIKEYTQADSNYSHLMHGPIEIDDYIGNAIEENENFKPTQAEFVKEGLNYVALNGYNFPPKIIAKAAWCMLAYGMKPGDAVTLYNKYIGDWGGESTVYRFEAIKDGKVVKEITKCPMKKRQLIARPSADRLVEKNSYDVAEIRLQMCDENGNQLYFYNDPVKVETSGPIELIGPDMVAMQGGMTGIYIKTVGDRGTAKVSITTATGEKATLDFVIEL